MFVIGDEYFEIEHHVVHAVDNSYIIFIGSIYNGRPCYHSCHYLHHYHPNDFSMATLQTIVYALQFIIYPIKITIIENSLIVQ